MANFIIEDFKNAWNKKDNGLIKIIAHDTNMKIPISNSIYMGDNNQNFIQTRKINLNIQFIQILEKSLKRRYRRFLGVLSYRIYKLIKAVSSVLIWKNLIIFLIS